MQVGIAAWSQENSLDKIYSFSKEMICKTTREHEITKAVNVNREKIQKLRPDPLQFNQEVGEKRTTRKGD